MPCTDGEPTPEEYDRSMKAVQKREREIKEKIDNLTHMLCAMLKIIHNSREAKYITDHRYERIDVMPLWNRLLVIMPGLGADNANLIDKWYQTHLESDKQRMAEAVKTGLAKLTSDEMEALAAWIKLGNS